MRGVQRPWHPALHTLSQSESPNAFICCAQVQLQERAQSLVPFEACWWFGCMRVPFPLPTESPALFHPVKCILRVHLVLLGPCDPVRLTPTISDLDNFPENGSVIVPCRGLPPGSSLYERNSSDAQDVGADYLAMDRDSGRCVSARPCARPCARV
jgi:hypothetical protein